ncbi:MAG: hypothetical protein ABSF24_00415 [Candidatus Bathyarchaeia archaeon]|jgi:hypothetical protein
MFEKKTCERCKKLYRFSGSGNRGKNYCQTCCSHCLVCGIKLPNQRAFGSYVPESSPNGWTGPEAWWKKHPEWGTGICFACENELKGKMTANQETTKATVLGNKTFWKCEYCDCLNELENKTCFNCGSQRKGDIKALH